MKRPHIVHLLAIVSENLLQVKASVAMGLHHRRKLPAGLVSTMPKLRLMSWNRFTVKLICLNNSREVLLEKVFTSDKLGKLDIRVTIPNKVAEVGREKKQNIESLTIQLYEISSMDGLELLLGTYIPTQITKPNKVVICDFDKTLLDTRYSTAKEFYTYMTRPLNHFKTVNKSVTILKKYIDEGFHPFILSASPHFYRDAIQNWLGQHKIYSAGIFLKDYRQMFGPLESALTPKDLKIQGSYKAVQLIEILLMTGIPDHLILIGDSFDSDPLIYAAIGSQLQNQLDPQKLWNTVKKLPEFSMNRKQDEQLLNGLYRLHDLLEKHQKTRATTRDINILIRLIEGHNKTSVPEQFADMEKVIQFYCD